jgi:glycine/D-amino acid oxidase-like deaminating enzyme
MAYDLIVIGGGLVGGAIAWGAAAKGASVALLDQGDPGASLHSWLTT